MQKSVRVHTRIAFPQGGSEPEKESSSDKFMLWGDLCGPPQVEAIFDRDKVLARDPGPH